MAHQSPMISIPKKTTDEVDWTTPIRNLIAQSYGESPDNYAAECAALQRCRQDAVRGAGSDITARDLLYKYFGQLELLELRFSEIRVNFPWRDALNNKLITQTSIAYEKASILFQIAATHSSIAASQNRSDPEGLKRSFYYFRTCAGMLTYINENFLHAPSTDLSRDVIKFLVNLILAQATEVFFEKCTDEKKGSALVSKVGAQGAAMYTSLAEEAKEFMGKGIFDRNWITLIQIKAKYFTSLSQYHRGLADKSAGKYGEALVRFNLAETLAKEASRSAATFASAFVTHLSPNLPSDAGPSIQERTKIHLALCTERKTEATRENDLIYNAVLPVAEALPAIDKAAVATPISIQDVYGTPEVQKVIGADLFLRLIPLSVHESASVYSEEKAKLVRGEVEKAEGTEGELRSALDGMGVKEGLGRFKAMAEGEVSEELPIDVIRWKEDISLMEERESVEGLLSKLKDLKEEVQKGLAGVERELETESKDCEAMRVKYEHLWTQAPSASLTKPLRQDLKSHFGALDAAATSDQQVLKLWDNVKGEIALLLSPAAEEVFRASTGTEGSNLLDLDVGSEANEAQERARIRQFVDEIEERLGRLNKIARERAEVLKDLKDKVQTDDVSHILLLNRRNTGVEPALFAAELEKFRPYQQRLALSVAHQAMTLQEVSKLWKGLKDIAGRGPGARKWDEREKKKKETVRRFSRARDVYMEVRDGLAKGLQFYTELRELSGTLERNVKTFLAERASEREKVAGQAEAQKRLAAPAAPPPLAEKPAPSILASALAAMDLRATQGSPPSAPKWNNQQSSPQPYPPPPAPQHRASLSYTIPQHHVPSASPTQYHNSQNGSQYKPGSASSGAEYRPPSFPPAPQYNVSSPASASQYNMSSPPPGSQYKPSPQPPLPQYKPSPPPPAPQYNVSSSHSVPQHRLSSSSSVPQYNPSAPPTNPPSAHSQGVSMFPGPPPAVPSQSSYHPVDPYAGLGMFSAGASQYPQSAHNSYSSATPQYSGLSRALAATESLLQSVPRQQQQPGASSQFPARPSPQSTGFSHPSPPAGFPPSQIPNQPLSFPPPPPQQSYGQYPYYPTR